MAYLAVVIIGRWRLTRAGGGALLALYAAYWLWQGLSIWAFDLFGNRDS